MSRKSFSIFSLILMGVMMFSFFSTKAPAAGADLTAHGFSFTTIDDKPLNLSELSGKVLLVVNTASKCGFTPQYDGLEALYKTYQDRGLVIIGVPSNDFGGQEPGTAEEIVHFCQTTYDITFPLTAKTVVSGSDAHPFYKWAADQKKGGMIFSKPRWNFHKYLVARDGSLAGSYSSATKPGDPDLAKDIEAELAKAAIPDKKAEN
jgi:glutathione peroxidase